MERYKEENPVARTLVTLAELLGNLFTVTVYVLLFLIPFTVLSRDNPVEYINSQPPVEKAALVGLAFLYAYFVYLAIKRAPGWFSEMRELVSRLTLTGFSTSETLRMGVAHSAYEYMRMLAGIWYLVPLLILLQNGLNIWLALVGAFAVIALQPMLYKGLNSAINLDNRIGYALFNLIGGETDWKPELWQHHRSDDEIEFVGCPDCDWKEKLGTQDAFSLKQDRCETGCETELQYGTVGSGWDSEP